MTDQIKTISEKSNFEKILSNFFKNDNVFLKTKNGDLKIQFVSYSEAVVAFRVPYIKGINGNCLIFTRHGNNTIHLLAKSIEKQEEAIFLFAIDKFQVIYRARGEERKSLDVLGKGESKSIIFVANLISHLIIQNSLAMETKKIERIREFILKEMAQAFNYSKILFCNEGKNDARMIYFFKNKKPIFIPQINNNNNLPDKEKDKLSFYINNIYPKDHSLQARSDLISEISIPLLYRQKLPYGYIQANNSGILTSATFTIVKKFALLIDELLNKEKVFPKSEEKLIVSNLSKGGVGIVFKERKYIRYFKENNYIYFDILLPDNKVASIMALVRNITLLDNKIIRIGCSIEEIDALSEVNYDEFLNTLPSGENKESTTAPEEHSSEEVQEKTL